MHDGTGGSDAGRLGWTAWTAEKHADAEVACQRAWDTFTPGGSVTVATLLKFAQSDGWSDPVARRDPTVDTDRRRPPPDEQPTAQPEPDEDWPTPQPITSELKPVPAFEPAKMLPEPLATWVHQQAYSMACPPEFIAVPVLVTLGSLIGTRCAVKPKRHDDWIEVPNLWGAVVGPPGSKKSPALSVAFGPLNHLITLAMKDHQQDLENHRIEKAVYDAETKILEGNLKPAIKKGGDAKAEAVPR